MNERRDNMLKMMKEHANDVHPTKDGNHSIILYQLIEDKQGYEALMDHLQKEFAIETLLFLTEMIQLKDWLVFNHIESKQIFERALILPNTIPQSSIIGECTKHATNVTEDFYVIYVKIYEKYICKDKSPLEINIPYSVYRWLNEYYKEITSTTGKDLSIEKIWDALLLATAEILSLLQYSAIRC